MTTDNDEEYVPAWYPYEGGATVGEIGPERGFILRDEEWGDPDDDEDADARLTLEQGRAENPGWFLTATLYGWMFHTFRAADEADANARYEPVKAELEQLIGLLPYEEDRDIAGKVSTLTAAINAFESKYPR